jgi:hypothetical protein
MTVCRVLLNTDMKASETGPSPDRFRVTVNGVAFEVVFDPSQPGAYHYTRLTGPASGHGFTARRSDHQRSTTLEHEAQIRAFLEWVEPVAGYVEDDPDDDGEVDTSDS